MVQRAIRNSILAAGGVVAIAIGASQVSQTLPSEQQASAEPSSTSTAEPSGEPVELAEGTVEEQVFTTDDGHVLQPETGTTRDAALDAFLDQAGWALASEDLITDPGLIQTTLPELNPADRVQLETMTRSGPATVDFTPGAYRVIGYSGPRESPDLVMVEAVARVTFVEETRWVKLAGVVVTSELGWTLQTLQPVEVPQPESPESDLTELPPAEAMSVLESDTTIGWYDFAPSGE